MMSLNPQVSFTKRPNPKQFGREVVLDMIVLRGPRKQSNQNQRQNETYNKENKQDKQTKKNKMELTN